MHANDQFASTRGMSDEQVRQRQLASRRVTQVRSSCAERGCNGDHSHLVTTPTRLRPTSEAWLNRLSLVRVK